MIDTPLNFFKVPRIRRVRFPISELISIAEYAEQSHITVATAKWRIYYFKIKAYKYAHKWYVRKDLS